MRTEVQETIREAMQQNADEIDRLRDRLLHLEAEQKDLSGALRALGATVSSALKGEAAKIVPHAGKYTNLWSYLQSLTADSVSMTFSEIEGEVLGFPLPPSSRKHHPHWYGYGGSAVARAIQDAGWKATNVDVLGETVTFVRQ